MTICQTWWPECSLPGSTMTQLLITWLKQGDGQARWTEPWWKSDMYKSEKNKSLESFKI